ncbi:MAG: hypothetical protein NVS4B2_25580 [Chloroflexota bacterium]
MREVHAIGDFLDALESARREAVSTSNSDLMFVERLLRAPRHIEVQILADHHGGVVALGERDCSVQRRHQKVLEEAPSPVLNADLRRSMSQDAVRLAQASGYTNAGTIEFLFSDDSYYFLEMNTRIQVEHPVTEEITGIDLVRRQIEIAAGYRLNLRQADVQPAGHAIEVRIYAEDSSRQFLPATGTIRAFSPPQGPGIRNDVGVAVGTDVTPYYDAMLAKLIVRAASRSAAIARLRDALDRYRVEGVITNLTFLSWLVRQPEFVEGRVSTDFLDATWVKREKLPPPVAALVAAACFEVLRPHASDQVAQPDAGSNLWLCDAAWRGFGLSRSIEFDRSGERIRVEVTREVDHFLVSTHRGENIEVRFDSLLHPRSFVVANGAAIPFDVVRTGDGLDVALHDDVYHFSIPTDDADAGAGQESGHGAGSLTSPMPGTVVKVPVRKGEPVSQGQTLVVVEAMKMEHIIQAPFSGVVRDVYFAPGDMVGAGAPVVRLERD